MKTDSK